jgi:hypothetical protein
LNGFLDPFSHDWQKGGMDEEQLVTTLKDRDGEGPAGICSWRIDTQAAMGRLKCP